jgi:hypothetical protein
LFQGAVLFTIVTIILAEETWGQHATPSLPLVFALNLPWLTYPLFIWYRFRMEHPFTQSKKKKQR